MSDGTMTADFEAPDLPASEEVAVEAVSHETDPPETGDEVETEEADEFEEIERNGKTYRIPAALKGELLMHSDYTRKTQEVAESRKALEAREATLSQQAEAQKEHVKDLGRLSHIEEQLEKYANVNWRALQEQDFLKAQEHFVYYSQLKEQRDSLNSKIQQAQEASALQTQQSFAKRLEETRDFAAREIKGWNADTDKALEAYARESGLTDKQLFDVLSPAFVKILHDAHVGRQLIQKQQAAAKTPKPSEEPPQPLTKVSKGKGGLPPVGLDDRLSTEEWVKRRNQQLRKSG